MRVHKHIFSSKRRGRTEEGKAPSRKEIDFRGGRMSSKDTDGFAKKEQHFGGEGEAQGRVRKWSGKWEAGPRGVVPPNAGSTLIAQVPFDVEEAWPPPKKEKGCRPHQWLILGDNPGRWTIDESMFTKVQTARVGARKWSVECPLHTQYKLQSQRLARWQI